MSQAVLRKDSIAQLVAEGVPRSIAETAIWNASSYNRIQERWTSEEMDEETTAKVEQREARIEKRIVELLSPYGITIEFGGDPRGYTVLLKLPSGRSNSFTGEGWGIA